MAYDNLPQTRATLEDGNLIVTAKDDNRIIAILGTAAKGDSTIVYDVDQGGVSTAASAYGKSEGTLIRGLYEAYSGGGKRFKLVRIGAKSAILTGIGTGGTLETLEKDDLAGQNVKLFFEASTGRLRVWRVSDDLLVYDNNPAYPAGAIDEHLVAVTGTFTTGGSNIGTLAAPITMAAADGVSGATYTAGSDGILLSRMELFEALYEGYKMLENEDIDVVIPRDAYLDDLNVQDMTTAEVSTLNTSAPWDGHPTTYPTRGTSFDALGLVFVQEYEGKYYFWWDMDRDGQAEIYPSVGSASAALDAFGTSLTSADFHEANFAYQLADFCYRTTEDEVSIIGTIGVKPPTSWAPKHVSTWIGKLPTYTEDSNGNLYIASSSSNGTGLYGNKWMAGKKGNSGTGLRGLTIKTIEGLAYGGFIATDSGWPDGTQQYDDNDHLIDIGKYISVVSAYAVFSNSSSSTSYMASAATYYGGFVTTMKSNQAPTNKLVPNVRLPFRMHNEKLDTLAGLRYVNFKDARKGIVVADAPTAARPDSDYQRLMTIFIVQDVIEALRAKADPFLGEGVLSDVRVVGLDTALDSALASFVPSHLERYTKELTYTRSQKIRGEASLKLRLVPVSELRQLLITLALSAG